MGHLLFVAVGTLGERLGLQVIVRTARSGTGLGVPSFWIWHGRFLFCRDVSGYVPDLPRDVAGYVSTDYFSLSFKSFSAAQRASDWGTAQSQLSRFRLRSEERRVGKECR